MELARQTPPVKAAKPFKSTIFAQLTHVSSLHVLNAIRVPNDSLLAMAGVTIWAASALGADILAFQSCDGLVKAFRAVAIACVVSGVA